MKAGTPRSRFGPCCAVPLWQQQRLNMVLLYVDVVRRFRVPKHSKVCGYALAVPGTNPCTSFAGSPSLLLTAVLFHPLALGPGEVTAVASGAMVSLDGL